MAKNPNKQRLLELAQTVRRSNSEAAIAIKALLPMLIDMGKDALVEARDIELTRLQGEVQALQRLLTSLTVEPVNIQKQPGE